MPHLLRSTTSPRIHSGPSRTSPGYRPQGYGQSTEVDHDLEPLRRQVSAIIDAILSDSKPEEAHVREKLRQHINNNPGQPEKALLCHLLAVSLEQEAS
ncbi:hypothetical protein [Pseudarthrobacter sp. 1C304]|uniref:hypothetical protein n=1 Tax=Pseudarthrobacter sp. 1C304 TaxID=3457438 RepID=UPI003FD19CD4